MVVGKELARMAEANPRYKAFFLDYDSLKKMADSGDAATLMAMLQKELHQVNDIVEVEWESLESQLKNWLSKGGADDITSLENLSKALLQLHEFSEMNYKSFRKIMTRCGERQSTSSCTWFMDRVDNSSFRQRNWDIALAQLGQLYAVWRDKSSQTQEGAATNALGEYSSEAYLVPVTNTMRVKVALLKKLRPAAKQVRIPTTSNTRATNEVTYDFKHATCRVYLDSARGDQYSERFRRRIAGEGQNARYRGALLQCRLPTGDGASDPTAEVHIDVEDNTGATTDVVLPQKMMPSLMNGSILPERFPNAKALDAAVTVIKNDQLRPSVSVHSYRSAFGGEKGEVLITLDEDMYFCDEGNPDAKAWCKSASKRGNDERKVAFVGGILRIWYPTGTAAAVQGFDPSECGIEADDLQPVPHFSEALHGMALIHRELASPLPPWIPAEALPAPTFTSTLLLPRSTEPSVATSSTKKPDDKAQAVKKALTTAWATEAVVSRSRRCFEAFFGAYTPEKEMLVDCKTPLSIERTLLRWLRSTVILASLSAFLMSAPAMGTKLNGLILGVVSLMFVVAPLKQFVNSSLDLMNPKSKQPRVNRTLPRVMGYSLVVCLAACLLVDIYSDKPNMNGAILG